MTGPTRTVSTETVRSSSPPPSDRQLRPKPHRLPSAATPKTPVVKVEPPVRPTLVSRPSLSIFVSEHLGPKQNHKYSVHGSCLSCMAAMRDAYDRMHTEHVKSEAAASDR